MSVDNARAAFPAGFMWGVAIPKAFSWYRDVVAADGLREVTGA